MKLWEKGYSLNKEIEEFTVGNDYILDSKLVRYDCIASIAHAKMLNKIGILDNAELEKISAALNEIIKLDSVGKFIISKEDEDCHTAIEKYLTKKIGKAGKKIHMARSRNDQVATALRLYYKDSLNEISELANKFSSSLFLLKDRYRGVEIPGYTHMRKAMPSSIGMWADAFIESMSDNKRAISSAIELLDQSPLGTGAGYGLPMKVDRRLTAKLLKFSRVQKSPIYVQNSRGKFEFVILNAIAMIMFDLNKMASDIILFSMPEFGYFEIPREFCTGSSIMPHKMNPDVLELMRARYHQIAASQAGVMGIASNLISGYSRDMQLTKGYVMDGIETAKSSLKIASLIIKGLKVDRERCKKAMTKELYSVKDAYELAKKGVAFRDAYSKVAGEYSNG